MTYREAINLGEKVLNMADVADAKIDAWLLLEMVCIAQTCRTCAVTIYCR